MHSDRMTAPRGWEIVRIAPDPDALKPSSDDLEALANAVREAARPRYVQPDRNPDFASDSGSESRSHDSSESWGARRGHLRVIHSVPSSDLSNESTLFEGQEFE